MFLEDYELSEASLLYGHQYYEHGMLSVYIMDYCHNTYLIILDFVDNGTEEERGFLSDKDTA